MNIPFSPHPVTWTREKSSRWWNVISSLPAWSKFYFSRMASGPLLAFLRAHRVPIAGRVIDFGCGPGYLLEKLLNHGIACEGVDFSPQSVEATRARLAKHPLFRGVGV